MKKTLHKLDHFVSKLCKRFNVVNKVYIEKANKIYKDTSSVEDKGKMLAKYFGYNLMKNK